MAHVAPSDGSAYLRQWLEQQGDRVLASAVGVDPKGLSARKVVGLSGGLVGAAVFAASERSGSGPGGGRVLVVTDRSVAQSDHGAPPLVRQLVDVTGAAQKGAFSSPADSVITVSFADGTTAGVQTGNAAAKALLAALASVAPAGSVRREGRWFLLKAFPVALLLFSGVSSLLLTIPIVSDQGAGDAAISAGIGVVCTALGLGLRHLLFRRHRS